MMPKRAREPLVTPPSPSLSLPVLFSGIVFAVVLLHVTLLRLPYFWDEGGYYIPAAWDFFRLGTLIPQTTMSNAHPPLPSLLLAGWWGLTGFHILSTRLLVCLVAAAALTGVFRLARLLIGQHGAWAVLALTAIYPVWFAQSTLAHADIFAAAFTLWALSFYVDRQGWARLPSHRSSGWAAVWTGLLFSLAALSKETAIVVPAALFCYELLLQLAGRRQDRVTTQTDVSSPRQGPVSLPGNRAIFCALATPVLPLALWFLYHHMKTGFTFGNPQYLRYNASANLSTMRVLLSLWHRFVHLSVHMELFVPLLLTAVMLGWPRKETEPFISRQARGALVTVVVVHWLAFAVLGGALLTRYLLAAYPALLLLYVSAWQQRTRWWPALAALSLAGFAIGCEVNPPYPFAPEDNLAYRDMIVLHQAAIRELQASFPTATVLTAWPAAAELQRPELGYLQKPMATTEIVNFTPEEVQKATEEPGRYDAALVFSTKYNPPSGGLNFAEHHAASDVRYFDMHRDLLPPEIARALGGTVVWQAERHGEWAAVLHFPRRYDARKDMPQINSANSSAPH